MVKHESTSLSTLLKKEWNAVSYIFLGVGLVLFLLNITSLLGISFGIGAFKYSHMGFNASVFSSILLILYVVYSLSTKSNK